MCTVSHRYYIIFYLIYPSGLSFTIQMMSPNIKWQISLVEWPSIKPNEISLFQQIKQRNLVRKEIKGPIKLSFTKASTDTSKSHVSIVLIAPNADLCIPPRFWISPPVSHTKNIPCLISFFPCSSVLFIVPRVTVRGNSRDTKEFPAWYLNCDQRSR